MSPLTNQEQVDSSFSEHKDISRCRFLLEKMATNWHQRAQVVQVKKKLERGSSIEMAFDETRDDFRVDLLPFRNHPDFLAAPVATQKKILSCGWLAYNEKTIDIESQIVSPVCNHIIYRELPGADDGISQEIASDTLTDEAYHILLVISACRITRQQRGLEKLKLPSFNLVINMRREQAKYSELWQKMLICLATATVSEVFISDYLDLLADDLTIQPLNQLTVATHRADEMAHSSIFKNLAKCIYSQLNFQQKEFFARILPKPIAWFANSELEVWRAILNQIGFSQTERLIADCTADNQVNSMRIDYSGITALAEELGILDFSAGFDSFGQAGLVK